MQACYLIRYQQKGSLTLAAFCIVRQFKKKKKRKREKTKEKQKERKKNKDNNQSISTREM